MGLDFNLCDAHWDYSGFNNFRKKLAEEIGINLDEMDGFKDGGGLHWDKIIDPIKYLLYHSDCDGELTVKKCIVVNKRLNEIIKDWDDSDYDKQQALLLVKGMKKAISKKVPLLFT